MTTRTWKIYGADGHRQRESFRTSESFTTWIKDGRLIVHWEVEL